MPSTSHMVSRILRIVALVLPLSSAVPAFSQTKSVQRPPTPFELQQFTRSFKANVVQGCSANPPKDVRNPRQYCNCYAEAFVARYQPDELALISNIAGQSPQNPAVISVMMAPDQRRCKSQ